MARIKHSGLHQRIPKVLMSVLESLANDYGSMEQIRSARGFDKKIAALLHSLSQVTVRLEQEVPKPPNGTDLERIFGEVMDHVAADLLVTDGISSIAEAYIKTLPVLKKLKNSDWGIFFRGQQNIFWDLLPSLSRCDALRLNHDNPYRPQTQELINLRDFQRAWDARCDIDELDRYKRIDADDCEWWFRMQHYGAPTRFLDLTTSLNAALMFACIDWETGSIDDGQDGVLFCFVPQCGVNLARKKQTVENIFQVANDYPVVIKNPPHNERSKAQHGAFMWWREFWNSPRHIQCYYLRIPKEAKRQIVEDLLHLGVGPANIVRGEIGIKNEIKLRKSLGYSLENL